MSKVKQHFTSRFKEEGCIVEADWKQLEVVVFAFLTQDPQLISDLREGRDVHRELGSIVYNCLPQDVTKEQRQSIKPCTFHVIYGGGAKRLSEEKDLDLEFCKQFINAFYTRYPVAKQWQDNLVRKVEATRVLTNRVTTKGFRVSEGYLDTITGRRYWFDTTDIPDFMLEKVYKRLGLTKEYVKQQIKEVGFNEYWRLFREQYGEDEMVSFSPPDIKNYPVQGFATADLHLIASGHLFRKSIKHRDKYLLVNTVHDSIVFDVRKKYIQKACIFIKNSLYYVKEILKDRFNIEFNVPLEVEFKVGDSWGDMKEYKIVETINE